MIIWKKPTWRAAGESAITSAASLKDLLALCSPSAAITCTASLSSSVWSRYDDYHDGDADQHDDDDEGDEDKCDGDDDDDEDEEHAADDDGNEGVRW